MKIWGRNNSINVQKVVWAAGETGRPWERVDAGGAFGIVGTPDYLARNPNALVPVLEDDGAVLWESNAIVRYLCSRYLAGTLWPTDPVARAHADKWMDWSSFSLYPAYAPAFMNLIRTPPEKRDAGAIAGAIEKTERLMEILDRHLAQSAFVGGDSFTMGDICVGCGVHRWRNLPISRVERPAVERWFAEVARRPAAIPALVLPIT